MDTTNTLSIFVRHGDVTHEMRSATCWACQETVNLVEDDWTPVRIGGDSANGYEPGHRNCRGIIAERQERRIEELERDLENIISGGSR